VILIIANYRTGSTTLSKQLGGLGGEYLHWDYGYRPLGQALHPREEYVIKVMPDQWHYDILYDDFVKDFIKKADKIYYSLRKDFCAQLNSYLYALLTLDWSPWDDLPDNSPYENGPELWEYVAERLVKNIEWQTLVYQQHGGKKVWLEDRLDPAAKYTPRTNVTIDVDWNSVLTAEQWQTVNQSMDYMLSGSSKSGA
jgi:hypothetical protein